MADCLLVADPGNRRFWTVSGELGKCGRIFFQSKKTAPPIAANGKSKSVGKISAKSTPPTTPQPIRRLNTNMEYYYTLFPCYNAEMRQLRAWSVWMVVAVVAIFALGIRLYRLDVSPYGALIDEAHFGYIAQSLLQTGRDEHGASWPLVFKGFGDQKLPGYGYVLLPVVKAWGLSVWSIRFPAAVMGAVLVGAVFWVVRELGFSRRVGVIAALLMAVSPWAFFLSRFGFESQLALCLFTIGLAAILRALSRLVSSGWQESSWPWQVLAGVCWAATWYSYIAYRPFTLGLVGVWVALILWQAWQSRSGLFFSWSKVVTRSLVLPLVIALCLLPLLHPSVRASNTARFKQVGLLNDESVARYIVEARTFCDSVTWKLPCYVAWNKGTLMARTLFDRYIHAFSPEFLATDGEAVEAFLTVEGFGQFVFAVYPLFLLGGAWLVWLFGNTMYQTWTTSPDKHAALTQTRLGLFFAGLVLAPIPAVLAGEPQKVRASMLLPFLIVLATVGLEQLWVWLRFLTPPNVFGKWARLGIMAAWFGIFTLSSIFYFMSFFTFHTLKSEWRYQSYARDLWPVVEHQYPDSEVYIKPFFSDPIMSYAFYTDFNPAEYQRLAILGPLETSGFQHTVGLGRLHVSEEPIINIGCRALAQRRPTIAVTNEAEPGLTPVGEIKSSNGGALTYAYIYDVLKYAVSRPDLCLGE